MGNELFLDFVAVLGFGAPFVYLLDYEFRKNGHEITPISNRAVYWILWSLAILYCFFMTIKQILDFIQNFYLTFFV